MTAFTLFTGQPARQHLFLRLLVLAALPLLLLLAGASGASAESATNGPRTLTVSQAHDLDPDGATISVSGSGYDTEKGIYIAFCKVPAPGGIPSPCGGGADIGGVSGSSIWISSNPPAYGEGVAIPYGDGGSFSATMAITPVINASVDCRVVACAVVTRSDHTRLSDRSQDVLIPVTFATPATPTPIPPTQAPNEPPATATPVLPTATPTATTTPLPTAIPATPTAAPPSVTLAADGLSATAGAMSLRVSANQLAASGTEVTVSGAGFDPATGVYVALCALHAGQAPGPCTSGASTVAAWISSNPPDYASNLAIPYGDGGTFSVTLTLEPVIDSATDCRSVACGITTRADDVNIQDRTRDIAIPVVFTAANTTPPAGSATPSNATTSTPAASTTPGAASPTATAGPATVVNDPDDGGSGGFFGTLFWFAGGGIVAAGIGGAALYLFRRRLAAASVTALALVALLLGACSDGAASPAGTEADPDATAVPIVVTTAVPTPSLPVTVASADGRQVTITDTSRIVSLWGNLTEIVFGLGLGENVVGRDISATFPEAANLPLVTRAHDTSAEGVLSLQPTLVLASKDNTGPSSALDHIRNVGIPVVVFDDPGSVDDVIPRIHAVAEALGVPAAGDTLAARVNAELTSIEAAVPHPENAPKVAFLYLRGQAGVYLLGGPRSGADSMIAAVGAIDAGTALGLSVPFTPITSESLAKAAPDIILMTQSGLDSVGGIDGLVQIPGIAQTPAGRDRRVITMDDALLYSFGARTPEALRTLMTLLYGTAGVPTAGSATP